MTPPRPNGTWDKARTAAYAVGIAGTFLIMVVLVTVTIRYTSPPPATEDRNEIRRKALAEMRAAEAEFLKTPYAWEDKTKGFVRVPIDRAEALVIQGYQDPAKYQAEMLKRVEKGLEKPPPPKSDFE